MTIFFISPIAANLLQIFSEINMTWVLFAFTTTTIFVKAANTRETPIVIQANNVVFPYIIPPQHQDLGIEDFVNFFKSCPLCYALSDVPGPFFPKQVCEFYYSCTIDANAQIIFGTVVEGLGFLSLLSQFNKLYIHLPFMMDYERNHFYSRVSINSTST